MFLILYNINKPLRSYIFVSYLNEKIMTFQEEVLYRADSFSTGFCLEIKRNTFTNELELFGKQFKNKDDMFPKSENMCVYSGLFKKDYEKVYTRQSLFK